MLSPSTHTIGAVFHGAERCGEGADELRALRVVHRGLGSVGWVRRQKARRRPWCLYGVLWVFV